MLAGHSDRAQNRGAAAVLRFLAIQHDQLLFGRRAAHLLLDGQNDFLHFTGIDALEQTAKSRLCRCGILALAVAPDTKARRCAWLKPRANLAMSFCPRGAPQRVAKKRIVNIDHSG